MSLLRFSAAALAITASALFALFGFTSCMSALEQQQQQQQQQQQPPALVIPSREPSLIEKPSPSATPDAPEPVAPAPSVRYSNCDAARADGAAPVYQGDPGYGSHLDRDGDGVACE